ncbi:MAG: NAD(P)H-dependent glycerol-3-phosphate dehydrogenase [Pontibacterium sp.]
MEEVKKIAVLGGGSFGTIVANMAAENGHQVYLWMRDQAAADHINSAHQNQRYLPDLALSPNLIATCDMAEAVTDAALVFVSIPSKAFSDVVAMAAPFLTPSQMLISTTKGIHGDGFALMSELLKRHAPNNPVGVLSGPNLAKEIANKQMTATVIASQDAGLRESVQKVLHRPYFRIYASSDMYGVELAGTLKNIYAIACGISSALGMGENTRSMLMTRSLAEMSRFAVCLGANPMTFIGLAGVGDLMVTCMSPLSRNYRVGFALGEGKNLEETVASLGQVAEGVGTLQLVKAKAEEMSIYMPLVWGLYEVVYNHAPVVEVAEALMMNEQSTDVEFVLPRDQM